MLAPFAACLLLNGGLNLRLLSPQKAKTNSQPAPSTQWGPTKLSPSEIAKKTDAALHDLTNSSVVYIYQFQLKTGNGRVAGSAAVKNSNTFRGQAPITGDTERDGPDWEARVANGGKLAYYARSTENKPKIGPINRNLSLPNNVIASWLRQNVKFLFDAIGTNANPLEDLVRSVKGTPGYHIVAQERTIPIRHHDVKQFRLYVSHDPKRAKVSGELYYEVVVDAKYFIPITMNNYTKIGEQVNKTAMFGTAWKRNLTKFPDRAFDLKSSHIEITKF